MNYRREVDGLRALAVVPVLLFHAGFQMFSGGFVGVDVFFVISGYLITSIILAEKKSGIFSLLNFWERRARRILPALYLVLLTCLPFAWFWLLPLDLKSFSQSLVAVLVFASNIEFYRSSGYFDAASEFKPLLHTWSLAVEEQYYMLFPIFLLLTWKLGKRCVLVILAFVLGLSLAVAQWGATAQPAATFYLLPTRGWELLIGALLAFYSSSEGKWEPGKITREVGGAIGIAMLAYAIFAFDKQTPFPSILALIPTLGAALIILFSSQDTVIGRLLGNRVFVGLGLISYSTYLWHQPLFAFARHRSIDEPSKLLLFILIILSVLLAYYSWKYVELPFRNKQRFNRKKILVFFLVSSSLFMAFGLLGYQSNGFTFRSPPKHLPADYFQNASYLKFKNFGLDGNACTSETASICIVSAYPKAKNFLLVGDSHSADFSVEFRNFVAEKKLNASQFSIGGCGFLDSQRNRHGGECGRAIDLLKATVSNEKFDVIIFITALHADQSALDADMSSLSDLVVYMANNSERVWLFTPRYSLSSLPMKAGMLNKLSQVEAFPEFSMSYIEKNFQQFRSLRNVHIFDQQSYLIELGGKGVEKFDGHTLDRNPLYRDSNHLTNYGAGLTFAKFSSLIEP